MKIPQNKKIKQLLKSIKNTNKILKGGIRIHKIAIEANKYSYIGFSLVVVLIAITPFINSYFSSKVIDSLIYTVSNTSNINNLLYVIGIYISFLIFEVLLGTGRRYFDNIQFIDFYNHITMKMLNAFSRLDIAYFENSKYSDAIQKARESYTYRPSNFLDSSFYIISDVISIISGFIIIVALSPLILFIILLSNLPTLFSNIIFGKRKYGIWSEDADVRRNFWDTSNYLDSERELREVKVFDLQKHFLKSLNTLLSAFQNRQKDIEQKRSVYTGILSVLGAFGFGYVYWLIAIKTISGDISIGQFTFYIASIRATSSSISSFLNTISNLYENGLYTLDVFKILDLKPIIRTGRKSLGHTKAPEINFRNVSFAYPSNKKLIYKNLDFKIKPGEKIAIVGKNGAGKTTLVKILSRFYDVTGGELLIDGTNIKDIKIGDWYKNLAILSQDFVKYHYDAKTNISLGKPNDFNLEEVIKASKLSGADEFIQEYKYKYDQVLDKRYKKGIDPSTGQWQKIALARAFYKNAPILILDEPTSAIDPKAEFEIFEKLFDYAKDKTVIIISHRFSTVRNADRIIVIDDGKIVEEGSHKELLELNGMYKEAYDLQKKGYEDV